MSTGTDEAPKPRKAARIVMTLRVSVTGKAAFLRAAEQQGYSAYTEWARDVLAAEVRNPKHKPTPKEKPRGR